MLSRKKSVKRAAATTIPELTSLGLKIVSDEPDEAEQIAKQQEESLAIKKANERHDRELAVIYNEEQTRKEKAWHHMAEFGLDTLIPPQKPNQAKVTTARVMVNLTETKVWGAGPRTQARRHSMPAQPTRRVRPSRGVGALSPDMVEEMEVPPDIP